VSINSIPEVEIKNTVGNPIPISGTVSVDNFAPVTLANTSLNDASGRLRTSNTRLLGEFRNMYGTTGPMEIQTHFEGAGTQTITPVGITLSASGDSFIVTFSQRYLGEVFSDFDEAVSYIDNFITNARKGENA
jgi:hypothetical protein